MKVSAIRCPKCGDIVYSRARHDYRSCSCKKGGVAIDGGFDYTKISRSDPLAKGAPQIEVIDIKGVTKLMLYTDWNSGTDKYGLIIGKKK